MELLCEKLSSKGGRVMGVTDNAITRIRDLIAAR